MAEWIAIAIALIGPIILHFVREGYVKRQLEDIETRQDKSFEYHKLHFAHADRSEIHQPSMSREVTEARYDIVDEKFKNLDDKIGTLVETMAQHIADDKVTAEKIDAKLELVRKSVQDLREDLPKWLDAAAERGARMARSSTQA